MRRERIESKVPILKDMGAHILGLDHDAPPLAMVRFVEYADYL